MKLLDRIISYIYTRHFYGPLIEKQLKQAGVEPPPQAFGGASK